MSGTARFALVDRLTFAALVVIAGASGGAGCGPGVAATYGPYKVDIPVSDGRPPPKRDSVREDGTPRDAAASSASSREAPFPAVVRATLPNGLRVATVTSKALPIVQVRALVRLGSGFGPSPAVATLTANMTKDGGTRAFASAELLRRIETLGTDLVVETDFDGTVYSMAVTSDQLNDGLALLAQVIREPRFDEGELRKLKARGTDEAEDAARASGQWTATRIAFHELFPERSPYATYGLTPAEIARVDMGAIRDLYRRAFVPKATTLVFAGNIEDATAKAAAERHFGSWTGGEPPKIDYVPPAAPKATRVVVAHRPRSAQSDVFAVMLAPPRRSEGWAAVRVANQVFGGGVASRLFADVREQRSLAYRTNAQIQDLAHGEQPLFAYAGTQTEKTAQAVLGLVENIGKMGSSPPTMAETLTARRYLSDVFAIRMETLGAIADMVVTEETLGLPEGYWDSYRRDLRIVEPQHAEAASRGIFATDHLLVVVAGDADVVGTDLARFGEVTVVDPEKDFRVIRTIPHQRAGEPKRGTGK